MPLLTATCIQAIATSHGYMTDIAGNDKTFVTFSLSFASTALASSPDRSSCGISLRAALSASTSSLASSSAPHATTYAPVFLIWQFNSSHSCGYLRAPITLSSAFSVPSSGSYPACTIAELAIVAPFAISFSLSSTATFNSYRESSLASIVPQIPAPMITMS